LQEAPGVPIGELEDMPEDGVVVFLVPHGSEFFRQSLWDDKDEHHIPLKKQKRCMVPRGVTAEGPQEFNV